MAEVWQTGGCLCGAIRYELTGKPKWTALCHCESCRRAASAPVVAWMGYQLARVAWIGTRSFFNSSAHAKRSFCPTCGSPMSFESTRWPGEIHLYGASLDDPEAYAPELHCYTEEHLSWLTVADDLPRFARSADEPWPDRP
ncbi:MAG: GFA family protein [Pseudomonadota bacterium]